MAKLKNRCPFDVTIGGLRTTTNKYQGVADVISKEESLKINTQRKKKEINSSSLS